MKSWDKKPSSVQKMVSTWLPAIDQHSILLCAMVPREFSHTKKYGEKKKCCAYFLCKGVILIAGIFPPASSKGAHGSQSDDSTHLA